MRRLALGLALSGGTLLTLVMAGCAPSPPPGVVYVRTAPPAAVSEVRVVAPGPEFVWVPGYHRWDGGSYVWVGGTWQRPPHAHAAWVSGRWVEHRGHGWYWVDGHWK